MSIQPIPPNTGVTTAGQLAARATQNDQALASWLGDHDDRIGDLESRSGTSVAGVVQTFADLPNPVERDGKAYYVVEPRQGSQDPSPAMWVSNGTPTWFGPIDVRGAATIAAIAAAVPAAPVRDALSGVGDQITAAGLQWEVATLTGGALDHARVQSAATAAAANGKRLYAAGTLTTDQTLQVTSDADLSGLTITYTGTGTAVRLGTTARRDRLTIAAPRVLNGNKSGAGWGDVAGSIGIEAINLQSCPSITIPHVRNFERGLVVSASGGGNVHNTFILGHLDNNKVNLDLGIPAGAPSGSWVNQSVFIGGRFSHDSTEGTNAPGTRHIRIGTYATHPLNNHLFLNPSIEAAIAEFHAEIGGTANMLINARWEAPGGARLLWAANASRNQVLYGYDAHSIKETWHANASTGNVIQSGNGQRLNGTGSTTPVQLLENSVGASSPVDAIVAAGAVKNHLDPESVYAVRRSVVDTRMKRPADPHDRLILDHHEGRIYFGTGADDPGNAYLGRLGARLRFGGAWPTTTTAPPAGGAGALPAAPAGYMEVVMGTEIRRIPYY